MLGDVGMAGVAIDSVEDMKVFECFFLTNVFEKSVVLNAAFDFNSKRNKAMQMGNKMYMYTGP